MRLIPLYVHKHNPELHHIIGNYGNNQMIRYSNKSNTLLTFGYMPSPVRPNFITVTEHNLRLTNSDVFYDEG